ncbi:glycosyltransferase [Salinibacter grassmerensis]|uniref:glycosyltransferase n=1 Tax=Salinibacter grassmerensis TaxID=3040353 RepID=UPI0021E73CB6|nr:glycosyltransferase [Salinibacter grassmerensis]
MKTLLVISPRFPPINAADMHRVRHSLPHFEQYGWEAEVWRVNPAFVERERDPLLVETLPDAVDVRTVEALNPKWTRFMGLGNVALRSLPSYVWQGSKRLAQGDVDLVYFSTTAYPVTILGRYWKRRFGVPYVIDMQDPWHTDYYVGKPREEQPPKFWFSYRLNKYLEPVAMRGVDGIVSVSQGYCDTLQGRYANVTPEVCAVIPFGAAEVDFEVMEESGVSQPFIDPDDDTIDIVYAGRGGHDMEKAARGIFGALRRGREEHPSLFKRVRMHFVGTSYAPAGEGEKTLEPIAEQCGVGDAVTEYTDRIPYFQSLRLLRDADHLVVPGSDDPDYTASKLYPYILSRRPVLAVFNQNSSVVDILRETRAGTAVTFNGATTTEDLSRRVVDAWTPMLERLPYSPGTDWKAFQPYTAKAMTRRQVEIFDRVVSQQ